MITSGNREGKFFFYHILAQLLRIIALIAKRLRAKFCPDCAILDTSMKFGTVVDHD